MQVAFLHLDGGARRSSGVDLLPASSLQLRRPVRLDFPVAGVRGAADPACVDLLEVPGVVRLGDGGGFRCRSLGIVARRLPAGLGRLLLQGIKRSLAGGAPPTALRLLRRRLVSEGLVCNLFSSGDLSVNCPN